MPDYSLYGIKDKAYGFLTRGCPRGCDFCIVGKKEGFKAIKVADLTEFWNGQKEIVLLDPNILACRDWSDLLWQLADTKALVDFTQGLDARMLTDEKCDALGRIRMDEVHFAWDRYEDKERYCRSCVCSQRPTPPSCAGTRQSCTSLSTTHRHSTKTLSAYTRCVTWDTGHM